MLQDAASRRPESPRISGWYVLLPLLAAAACPICFFLFDQPIARFFRSIDHSILVRMAGYLTDLGQAGWYIGGAGLLYLVWRYWRPSPHRAAAGFVMLAVACVAGLAEMLEKPLGRARPRLLFEDGAYGFAPLRFLRHYDSFPSSHAASALAVATAIALVLPARQRHWRTALLLAGLLVAATRVAITAHYLSDVLAGAAVGSAGVLACHALARRQGWI